MDGDSLDNGPARRSLAEKEYVEVEIDLKSGKRFRKCNWVHRDDEAILRCARAAIPDSSVEDANAWLVAEKLENLERQDREEGERDVA